MPLSHPLGGLRFLRLDSAQQALSETETEEEWVRLNFLIHLLKVTLALRGRTEHDSTIKLLELKFGGAALHGVA